MAQIVAGDPASVLSIDHGVRVVGPVRILASKWMFADIATSRVDFDAVHCRLFADEFSKAVVTHIACFLHLQMQCRFALGCPFYRNELWVRPAVDAATIVA